MGVACQGREDEQPINDLIINQIKESQIATETIIKKGIYASSFGIV